jgi:plastocyanin
MIHASMVTPSAWRRPASRPALAGTLLCAALVSSLAGPGLGATAPRATGSIEGRATVPKEPASRSAERYMDDNGVRQDVPRIPVVVRIEGPIAGAAAAKMSGPAEMMQKGRAFSQLLLVVPVGTTVQFPNGDPVFHNVFSYSRPKRFDLGRYRRGESKGVRFDTPGYVKVMCEVHKWMRTAIVVVDNPFYAIVPESGQFKIDGVPAGRYRLIIEDFDRRPKAIEIDVPEGGAAHVDVTL